MNISYSRLPKNDLDEVHICVRCSDDYSVYAPVVFFSVLENNPSAYIYFYVFTDEISSVRWNNILKVTGSFSNCEIHKIVPSDDDLNTLKDNSKFYHGWDFIHVSVFYEKYLPLVKYCFNFGLDSFCVGDLRKLLLLNIEKYHIIGTCTSSRHQSEKRCKQSFSWLGFDAALINFGALRSDGISSTTLIDASTEHVGYIHDEVAFNSVCKRLFLNERYHYIYTGSYRPKRVLDTQTVIVDFYSELKPWDISVPGYEIFDSYIRYYDSVSRLINLEFSLPTSFFDAFLRLRRRGVRFVFSFPILFRFSSKFVFRACLAPSYFKRFFWGAKL